MITAEQYKKYSQSLAQISERAQGRFEADMKKVAGESIDVQVEAAKYSLKIINAYYGDMAATVSAEWFEALGEQQAGKVYDAVLAETWPDHKIEGSVDYARRHLEDGNPEKFLSYLDGTTDKAVKQAARDTIIQSCERYEKSGVRYARVPQGPTCPFCIMLASRGFIYHSEDTAGEFEKFHSHCDCEIVPSWEKSPRVEGYDPEGMKDRYLQCRDTLDGDWLKKTYSELPVRERAGMTFADFERKHILAEMGTRDRAWLYKKDIPEVEFVSDQVKRKVQPHELATAERLSESHGMKCVFIQDYEWITDSTGRKRKIGLPDLKNGIELKAIETSKNPYGALINHFDSTINKRDVSRVVIDNTDSLYIDDKSLIKAAHDLRDRYPEIRKVTLLLKSGKLKNIDS